LRPTGGKKIYTGQVATRPREAGDETKLDRVLGNNENDRNGIRYCFCGRGYSETPTRSIARRTCSTSSGGVVFEAKNKGRLEMFFLLRIKAGLARDGEGYAPNDAFLSRPERHFPFWARRPELVDHLFSNRC
jgi:hypothetical protein